MCLGLVFFVFKKIIHPFTFYAFALFTQPNEKLIRDGVASATLLVTPSVIISFVCFYFVAKNYDPVFIYFIRIYCL